jgi:hypothetical protein
MVIATPYAHTDGRVLLLGKKAPKRDTRDLLLKDFLTPTPAPVTVDWYMGVTQFGMMLNNTLGDCTCAAVGHGEQVATLIGPYGETTPVDDAILGLYEKACGYVPGNPATDQGGDINTVLNSVRNSGLGKKEGGKRHHRPLYSYSAVDYTQVDAVKEAIATLGVVNIGLQLPLSAQAQTGTLWTNASGPNAQPGSWGGHSVVVCAYDAKTITCITWGQLQPMTWEFFATYVDEAFALLYRAWMERPAVKAEVNLPRMDEALQLVAT